MIQDKALAGESQLAQGATNSLLVQVDCIGNPNETMLEVNTYAYECYAKQNDISTGFTTVVWQNTQTNENEPPTWVQYSQSAGSVQTVKVSIDNAAVLTLHSVPVQLLPAAPTGTVYQILGVMAELVYATAAFATHTSLGIADATTGDVIFSDASVLLTATETTVASIPPLVASATAPTAVVQTTAGAIEAIVASGNPATGGGSLNIYLTYRVVTL